MAQNHAAIVGLGVRFPECNTPSDFWGKLLDGVNMVTENDRRWPAGKYGLPKRNATLAADLEKFDGVFYGMTGVHAQATTPIIRLALATTFEAFNDAGLHPNQLRGSETGVYASTGIIEDVVPRMRDMEKITGYELMGGAPSMLSGRISFTYDLRGPSKTLDTACSGFHYAVHDAATDIATGRCQAAVAVGAQLTLSPSMSLAFHRMKMTSNDGACKTFDSSADGFARAEALGTLLLLACDRTGENRSFPSRDPYAVLLGSATNSDGYKTEGITFPNKNAQVEVYKRALAVAGIQSSDVSYVEAHGTGTVVGDAAELWGIDHVYGRGASRTKESPLLLGAVKSCTGHGEAAAGMLALVKVLLSFREGKIPGNLHFKAPNTHSEGLANGWLKPITTTTEWNGNYASVTGFGFSGSNVHLVLGRYTPKEQSTKQVSIPDNLKDLTWIQDRVKLFYGRNASQVKTLLSLAESFPKSDIGPWGPPLLIDKDHADEMYGNVGTVVEGSGPAVNASRPTEKPKLILLFIGNGGNWKGMGKKLYFTSKVFKHYVDECNTILQKQCGDNRLYESVVGDMPPEEMVKNGTWMGALVAIEVGIFHILKDEFGLLDANPDYKFMGHSTGDFLCGYVEGSLSLEQTLMMAVARDLALGEAGLIGNGQVIAAGMTHIQATAVIEEVLKDDAESLSQVAVGCINSRDSVTISGVKPAVLKIYEVLQSRGIFTRLVNTGGVASHSPMLKKATEGLIKILSHYYSEKKLRSDKWITMSPPFIDGSDGLNYCSAEYFMNNYTSRVYFEEVQRSLPKESVVLEIGPSPILSSHIRRTRPDINLIPTLRPDSDDVVNICETFAALWRSGLVRPYLADQEGRPAVAHRTDSLQLREALAYWEPTDACPVPDIIPGQHNKENEVTLNTENSTPAFKLQLAAGEPHNFLLDHVVAKQPMVPAAFYLAEVVPWALVTQKRLLVNSDNTPDPQQGLRYRKVRFLRAVPLSSSGQVTFHCHLTRIAEEELPAFKFHILQPELEEALVTGECAVVPQPFASENKSSEWKDVGVSNTFGHDEFYSMVWGNAASFGPKFATVQQLKLNACGDNHHGAYVNGSGSWTLLMDGMAQAYFVAKYFLEPDESEGYGHPVLGVREMVVSNPLVPLQESSEKLGVKVELDMETGRVQGPLCIVQGLQTEPFPWKVVKGPGAWVGAQVFLPVAMDKDGKRYAEPVGVSWPASSMTQALLSLVEQTSGPAAFHPSSTCWVLPNDSQGWLKDSLDSVLPASLRAGLGKSLPPALVWDASSPLPSSQYSLVLVPVDQNPNNALSLATQLLPDWGFLVAWASKAIVLPDQKFLDSLSVEIISNIKSKDGSAVLLRKLKVLKVSSTVPYTVQSLRGEEFVKLKDTIIEAVDASESPNTVWLHGECPGIMGLYKCLRREPGDRYNNLRLLSGSKTLLDWASRVDVGIVLAHPIDKQPGTYVHIPLPEKDESLANIKGDPFLEGVHIEFADKGDLDSAVWVQNTHLPKVWEEINEEELNNLVRVDAVGLNFRDVLLAYGKLTRYAYFGRSRGAHWPGSEFSGQAISGPFKGQKVMGMANDAMATVVRAPEILLWKVPSNVTWTPEQCASIPCAYATVYYALIVRANLQKGQSILVQAAAGAVGMAALRVAFWRGCTNVYATCSQAKREALLSTFPELKPENVFNSRNDSFEREVLLKTQGRGVDIVLNSLAGNLLEAGLRCVASNGHFLELGKVDMVMHTPLDLNYLLRNVTFHCIDVDLAISSPVWQVTKNLLQQGLESGEVIPIPVTSFPPDQVPQMLRFMAEGRHTGKVVLDLNGKVPPTPTQRFQPRKDGVYVITGGLGGVGLRLGKWLVDLGARHIVLVSRTGVKNGMQAQRIGHLTFKGAKVTVSTQDAGTSLESAIKLLDESIANHDNLPIAGVFHLAMVLDDKLFENHTKESWERVLTCKADGGKFLEEAMALKGYWEGDLPTESKPFLCHFSSVSSGFGSAGQSNYGLANAMLDDNAHVSEKRRVLSIQWGGIGRFGVITRAMSSGQGGKYAHISLQDVESCFQVLESLLLRSLTDYPVVTSFAPGVGPADEQDQSESSGDVVQRVLDLLRCSADSVAENVTLGRLGMDSLQAIEVQNVIRSATGKSIPAAKLRTTTLAQLKALSAEE